MIFILYYKINVIFLHKTILEGTVGTDVPLLVSTWCRGMDVTVKKVKPSLGYVEEPDYGFCEASIGKLDMDVDKLEANLTALLYALHEQRPMKRRDKDETFITRCILKVFRLMTLYPFMQFMIQFS